MWLGRLRFSAIRSEGADGCRGIFCKEFNAPTAIHCFRLGLQTMNARDDDFHLRPGRILAITPSLVGKRLPPPRKWPRPGGGKGTA